MGEVARISILPDAAMPINPEAEQQVLGTLMLDPDAISVLASFGGPDLFGDPVHRNIYRIISERHRAQEAISPVVLAGILREDEGLKQLGGSGYLVRVAAATMSASALPSYAKLLSDLAGKRDLIAAMSAAQAAIAKGEDQASVIAARLESALTAMSISPDGKGPVSMLQAVTDAMEQVFAAYHGEANGAVKTGFPSIDDLTGGFHPGELTLLGGRPGMGKSALMLAFAVSAARAGKAVCIASLEMTPQALAIRAISDNTANLGRGVSYSSMRRGTLSMDDARIAAKAADEISRLPIVFLPPTYADTGAMLAGVRQASQRLGRLDMFMVDYAQLLRSQAASRYEQVTEISRELKGLAMRLNIPVVALSQLSREVEKRPDKRPQLSDLRESGQLEQDADSILFAFREAYYLEREKPSEHDLEATSDWMAAMSAVEHLLEVIVAKNRQGDTGVARLRANLATNTVWEG